MKDLRVKLRRSTSGGYWITEDNHCALCIEEFDRVFGTHDAKRIELVLANRDIPRAEERGWLSLDPLSKGWSRWSQLECGDGTIRGVMLWLQESLDRISPEGSTVYMGAWILQ